MSALREKLLRNVLYAIMSEQTLKRPPMHPETEINTTNYLRADTVNHPEFALLG